MASLLLLCEKSYEYKYPNRSVDGFYKMGGLVFHNFYMNPMKTYHLNYKVVFFK